MNNDPKHIKTRNTLRTLGPILLIIGILSFASIIGGSGAPSAFQIIGFFMIPIGFGLTATGFTGAIARYHANEAAPVAKDTFNYMADGTKEGVKTIAKAIHEGINDNQTEQTICPKCGDRNDKNDKFCGNCGSKLSKTCPNCHKENESDNKYCSDCGIQLD